MERDTSGSGEQDYRWTLVYNGKDAAYLLTEARLIDGDWLVARTEWETIQEAIGYIRQMNDERRRLVLH